MVILFVLIWMKAVRSEKNMASSTSFGDDGDVLVEDEDEDVDFDPDFDDDDDFVEADDEEDNDDDEEDFEEDKKG